MINTKILKYKRKLDKCSDENKAQFYKKKLFLYKKKLSESSQHAIRNNKIITETFNDYKNQRRSILRDNVQWGYDIVDGKTEKDKVIYKDDDFTLIPGKFQTEKINEDKFHILAFSNNKKIMTMRDLTGDHIAMLENIKRVGSEKIKSKYGIDSEKLNIFVHYPPQIWLFHVHFFIIGTNYHKSSVEYSYKLDDIIFNLKLDKDYYKKINITAKMTNYSANKN